MSIVVVCNSMREALAQAPCHGGSYVYVLMDVSVEPLMQTLAHSDVTILYTHGAREDAERLTGILGAEPVPYNGTQVLEPDTVWVARHKGAWRVLMYWPVERKIALLLINALAQAEQLFETPSHEEPEDPPSLPA